MKPFEVNQINTNAVVFNSQSFTTVAAGANNNNVEVQKSLLFVTSTSDDDPITGFVVGDQLESGKRIGLVVNNVSATNKLVIKNEDANSLAANRIVTKSGADVTLPPSKQIRLLYNPTTSRWEETNVITNLVYDNKIVELPTDTAVIDLDNYTLVDGMTLKLTLGNTNVSIGMTTLLSTSKARGIEIEITQNGTTARTVTWTTNILTRGGTTPSQSTALGSEDSYTFRSDKNGKLRLKTHDKDYK